MCRESEVYRQERRCLSDGLWSIRASHWGPSSTPGNTYAAVANDTDPRSTPVCGSTPNGTLNGLPEPRGLPRALKYRSSLGLLGNNDRSRVTASAVGISTGRLAVEWLVSP